MVCRFQRLEKEEAYAVTDELATSKDAPAGATSTVRREQAKKEAEADKQKGKAATSHKPGKDEKSQKAEKPADIMEEDEVKPKEDKKKRKEDEKEDALDQSGVNQSSEWTNPMDRDEEDYDSGARDKATSADEGKDEFNLMLGLQRDKRARTGDEAGRDEGEEREAKLMKTTEGKKLEKGDDDEGEADAGEDEGDDDLGGEGEEEDEEEFMETSSGGRTVSRAAQLEEDIKTYIRKNGTLTPTWLLTRAMRAASATPFERHTRQGLNNVILLPLSYDSPPRECEGAPHQIQDGPS
jgi:hypothetical protein